MFGDKLLMLLFKIMILTLLLLFNILLYNITINIINIYNYPHHAELRWNINLAISDGIVVHIRICHVVVIFN